MKQKTLGNEIGCSGVGLHSGKQVSLLIKPAPANTGIVFRRTDLNKEIKASYEKVSCTMLGTTISDGDVKVSTIEHLMAAFWGCDIDNAIVEIDAPEIPIMDGSAEPFVFLMDCAGVVSQDAPKYYIQVMKKIEVQDGDSTIVIEPSDEFSVQLEVDFNDNVIGKQRGTFTVDENCFKRDISRARTFGFEREIFALRKQGLALGGSLDNAIVVGDEKVLNSKGLRYVDEFARHKILDCIGDLFLAGTKIKGKVTAYKSGHSINNKVLKTMFADKESFAVMPDVRLGVIAMKKAVM